MCIIEESFDTIFNMVRGGRTTPPHELWVGKITHGRKGQPRQKYCILIYFLWLHMRATLNALLYNKNTMVIHEKARVARGK